MCHIHNIILQYLCPQVMPGDACQPEMGFAADANTGSPLTLSRSCLWVTACVYPQEMRLHSQAHDERINAQRHPPPHTHKDREREDHLKDV